MLWHLDKAAEVLRWYRDYIVNAPEEMNGWFAFLTVPPGAPFPEELHLKKMCAVVWCYTGSLDKAEEVFKPIRSQFGGPALDFVGPIPYPALQRMFDPIYPPRLQWYWRDDWVKEISDEAIAEHVKYGSELPTMHSTMHMYPISGKPHSVGKNDTAFSYRDANWGMVIVGVDPDPANNEKITSWAKTKCRCCCRASDTTPIEQNVFSMPCQHERLTVAVLIQHADTHRQFGVFR
jgi:hypothetical protein